MKQFKEMGTTIGELTQEKNAAYGDSFAKAGEILAALFPNGIQPSQYRDALGIVRVIDKLFRIATRKDAFGESPWRDIAGYAILGAVHDDASGPVSVRAPDPIRGSSKFKVGDRVKVRSPDDYYDESEGEVVMIGDDDYEVRLDVDDAEFFFGADELELIEPAAWSPKAGARVRLIHPSGWAGAEGTVKELLPEGWAHVQINENIGFTTPCAWTEPV